MRTTTRTNTPTRMAKNGPASGKYCIWPMGDHQQQGGWQNRLTAEQRGPAEPVPPSPTLPSPACGGGEEGRVGEDCVGKGGTGTVRRQSKLRGRLCLAYGGLPQSGVDLVEHRRTRAQVPLRESVERRLGGVEMVVEIFCPRVEVEDAGHD